MITAEQVFEHISTYYEKQERDLECDRERLRIRFAISSPHGRIRLMFVVDGERNTVQVHTFSPIYVPKHKLDTVSKFTTLINYQTHYGGFEMDYRDGELSFCIYLLMDEEILPTHYQIETMERVSVLVLHKYLPGIYGMVYGDLDAEAAILKCEKDAQDEKEAKLEPDTAEVHAEIEPKPNQTELFENEDLTEEQYIQLGETKLFENDDFKGSIADFSKALEINPLNAEAYGSRAIAKKLLADECGALEDFNTAIELEPNPIHYCNRANLLTDLGLYPEAIADLDQSIELEPDEAIHYASRGNIKRLLGDINGATYDIEKAIQIEPNNAFAYRNRGLLHSQNGDTQNAQNDYDKAVELSPNTADLYFERALFKLNTLQNVQEALSDFDQTLNLYSRHSQALYHRGVLKISQLNDKEGGIKDLQKAAKQGFAKAVAKLHSVN